MYIIEVLLPLPVSGLFSYEMPDFIGENSPIGRRVLVPFGMKKVYTGIVWQVSPQQNTAAVPLKSIIRFIDDLPILTPVQMRLWEWIADYYMCTLGEVMRAALPTDMKIDGVINEEVTERYKPKMEKYIRLAKDFDEKELLSITDSLSRSKQQQKLFLAFLDQNQTSISQSVFLAQTGFSAAILKELVKKNILFIEEKQVGRLQNSVEPISPPKPLTVPQQTAFEQIQQLWTEKNIVLLHGVTSSGKTEVYIHLIQEAIAKGQQVLYLVPEIALTTQLTDRLQQVFGDKLGVYHSHFSDAERVEIYLDFKEKQRYSVLLGTRSSVLLPFQNLGLVIIDEEHETSYKQQDPAPRYHARSVAIMLAHFTNAKVLLGSATPSIETYHNAVTGKYGLVTLTERYAGLALPKITLVNTKEQYHRKEMTGHFSDVITHKITDEIGRNKQIIVFQNRRGYAHYLECKQCGYVPKCKHCDVSLTKHERQGVLSCHYCGYSEPIPLDCPNCHTIQLNHKGFGTEMVEDELQSLFPSAKIARLDLDTTRTKHGYKNIIRDFAAHKIDVLVGTQMVSKGLDFEDVSLVAVLNADNLMNKPDFRAYEQAFQMLEQVSGRAGRKGEHGEVVIQSFEPEHLLLQKVVKHDYVGFYKEQIAERKTFCYPPFFRLIQVHIRMHDVHLIDTVSGQLQQRLATVFPHRCSRVIIPSVSRVNNVYIRHIIMKIEVQADYKEVNRRIQEQIDSIRQTPDGKGASIYVDVDPN